MDLLCFLRKQLSLAVLAFYLCSISACRLPLVCFCGFFNGSKTWPPSFCNARHDSFDPFSGTFCSLLFCPPNYNFFHSLQYLKQQISVLPADPIQILLFIANEGSDFPFTFYDDPPSGVSVEMNCETSPTLEDRLFEKSLLGTWRMGCGGRSFL